MARVHSHSVLPLCRSLPFTSVCISRDTTAAPRLPTMLFCHQGPPQGDWCTKEVRQENDSGTHCKSECVLCSSLTRSLHRDTHWQKLQGCGVMEFSAPEGKAFMPFWMMQNLLLRDGGRATFESKRNVRAVAFSCQHSTDTYITCSQIPKATSVRFQPHTADFLDMAASMGPKVQRRCLSNIVYREVSPLLMLDYTRSSCWRAPCATTQSSQRVRPLSLTGVAKSEPDRVPPFPRLPCIHFSHLTALALCKCKVLLGCIGGEAQGDGEHSWQFGPRGQLCAAKEPSAGEFNGGF